MRKELDDKLCEDYPLIFKDRSGDLRRTLMCWGFEVDDGWYPLIDTACSMIYADYSRAARDYARARENEGIAPYNGAEVTTAVDVERRRIAMTRAAENLPVAVQVKEKFGTLRFYTNGGSDVAQACIEFAEIHSARTCETCGAPGTLRTGGWLRTLCDQHAPVQSGASSAETSP